MEKGLWDGAYMRILLNGKWHVVLEDGTTGQMDLPGTLDENGIGHRDVGANQWHPDAVLGNAAGEIDKDAPIATRFTRRHTYEGEARISRKITVPDYGTDRLFVLAERARALRLLVDGEACSVFRQGTLSTPYILNSPGRHRENMNLRFFRITAIRECPKLPSIILPQRRMRHRQTGTGYLANAACIPDRRIL